MKKYIKYLIIFILIILPGCSTQKYTDIVIDDSKYSQTTKKQIMKEEKENITIENNNLNIEKNAREYLGGTYKCNDDIYISEMKINIKDVKISKEYEVVEKEAFDYFKSEWIQKGSLNNYNPDSMSLAYVYINVKNTTGNVIECPIGMAGMGNYYGDNKYYRLSECSALYPSSYEKTTHCLFDELKAYEEKTYILLFKLPDKYTEYLSDNSSGNVEHNGVKLCLELAINSMVQGNKAPLVILDNITLV